MFCKLNLLAFFKACLIFPLKFSLGSGEEFENVELKNSLIWGPGVEGGVDFNLPVWYFFLQLRDQNGANVTGKVPPDFIKVFGHGNVLNRREGCRIAFQVIDRGHGSYVVRYKAYTACTNLKIRVSSSSDPQPLILNPPSEILCPDAHYCPLPAENWKTQLNCQPASNFLKADLDIWPPKSVNFSQVLSYAKEKWASHPGAYSFCHYVFINNEIWRKCYGQHVGFNKFSDDAFLSLSRKVVLANTEFLMNLGDWPLESRPREEGPIPIISWCGSRTTTDIILPTYEIMEATLQMMGRQMLDIQSIQKNTEFPWSEKIKRGFFRGRDSSRERLSLVLLAKQNPELLEAGITRFFFFRDQMDVYGPENQQIPLGHFFKYAYQINMDGTVAAYRLAYLLAGGSLVLKQESPYYEFFYNYLKPWVHYVPIQRDLSDLVEKIQWARDHETEEYSRILQQLPVEPHEDMERVEQPSESDDSCPCHSTQPKPRRNIEL